MAVEDNTIVGLRDQILGKIFWMLSKHDNSADTKQRIGATSIHTDLLQSSSSHARKNSTKPSSPKIVPKATESFWHQATTTITLWRLWRNCLT